MKKFAKLICALLGLFVVTASVTLTGCSSMVPNGSKLEIPYGTGIDDKGDYDTSLFYRNDKTVFNADPQVIYVSPEQDEVYGG